MSSVLEPELGRVNDLLRDYSRQQATITQTVHETGRIITLPVGPRGQHGAKAFVALQRVLESLERMRTFHGWTADEVGAAVLTAIRKGLE